MKSVKTLALLAAFVSAAWVLPSSTEAKQYRTPDGRVVHTRLVPVIAHRISPPFHGRHIYHRGPRR